MTANIELWDNSGGKLQLLITTEAEVMSLRKKDNLYLNFMMKQETMVVLLQK